MSSTIAAVAVAIAGLGMAPPAAAGLLPIAVADSYDAVRDEVRTVAAPGVLANDLQLGGGFTADLVDDVDHGALDLNGNGGFQYTPDAGYVGSDTFRYKVNGGLLGLSNSALVTITVSAPPATPTPTPTPTPKPTATPTPAPTIAPLPTLRPLPTLPPLPSASPLDPTWPTPTPTPRATPAGTARPASTSDPSDPPVVAPAGPIGSAGGGASTPPGSGPTAPDSPVEPFIVPAAGAGDGLDLDATSVSFGGFEWAVPALVLTVPGILIVIAVVVQTMIGLAWLPVARRSLENDRRRRRPGFAGVSSR